MQVHGTAVLAQPEAAPDIPAGAASALVASLGYGELAVALYASDMPTSATVTRSSPPGQIAMWAAQGLTKLGEARVWQLDYRSRQSAPRPGPEYGLIWPSRRRAQTAHNLSHRYDQAHGRARPRPEMVYIPLPMDEINEVWEIPVLRRDLENAKCWGWPAAISTPALAR